MSAEPREPAIKQIEQTGAENEPDGGVKQIASRVRVRYLQQCTLQNFQGRGESAKQISRRHQIRQEVNLWIWFAHYSGSRAIIVDPPDT
jgi:hypothetical protein